MRLLVVLVTLKGEHPMMRFAKACIPQVWIMMSMWCVTGDTRRGGREVKIITSKNAW